MASHERVSKAEYLKRLDVMVSLEVRGLPYSQRVKYACAEWGISVSQAKRYIAAAKRQIKKEGDIPREEEYLQNKKRLLLIYHYALAQKNFELARRTVGDLDKMSRQNEKESVNAPNQSHQSHLFGQGELEELIRALENERPDYPE